MMQSRSRENAMLATVSRLRRLLRKADLATKLVRVMGTQIFYTASSPDVETGLAPSHAAVRDAASRVSTGNHLRAWTAETPVAPPNDSSRVAVLPARIKRKICATPVAESCPMASAGRHPQSEPLGAACAARDGRQQSRGVLCRESYRP